MAYSKQTFTTGQVLTAAQQNQLESNIADHVHGRNSVAATGVSYPRTSRTSNFTVTASDAGELFDCSGSFTINFNAASGLGAGFAVTIDNNGSSDLTLDPDSGSGETIDGNTSLVIGAGAGVIVYSDGSNLHTMPLGAGGLRHVQRQTASSDASLTFTGLDESGVDSWIIICAKVLLTASASLYVRFGTSGGINTGTNYHYIARRFDQSANSDGTSSTSSQSEINLQGLADTSAQTSHLVFQLDNFGVASANAHIGWHGGGYDNAGEIVELHGAGGITNATGTWDRIQLIASSGSITSGEFTLFKVRR